MRRLLLVVTVMVVMAAMMVAMAAPAFAQGTNPQGLGREDTDDNCGIGTGASGDFYTFNRGKGSQGDGSSDHFDYSNKGNGEQKNPQGKASCM